MAPTREHVSNSGWQGRFSITYADSAVTYASSMPISMALPQQPSHVTLVWPEQTLGTGWFVSVSQTPAGVCLKDLAWDYPGV